MAGKKMISAHMPYELVEDFDKLCKHVKKSRTEFLVEIMTSRVKAFKVLKEQQAKKAEPPIRKNHEAVTVETVLLSEDQNPAETWIERTTETVESTEPQPLEPGETLEF